MDSHITKHATPEEFDALVQPKRRDRIIWTLQGIGARIGVGPDFVRDRLAKQPGSPIKEIGGRYYAFEDDLIGYLRERMT